MWGFQKKICCYGLNIVYGFWVSPIQNDGSGDDNMGQNEKGSNGAIVDDSEMETNSEESSENDWSFPDGDSHSKFHFL